MRIFVLFALFFSQSALAYWPQEVDKNSLSYISENFTEDFDRSVDVISKSEDAYGRLLYLMYLNYYVAPSDERDTKMKDLYKKITEESFPKMQLGAKIRFGEPREDISLFYAINSVYFASKADGELPCVFLQKDRTLSELTEAHWGTSLDYYQPEFSCAYNDGIVDGFPYDIYYEYIQKTKELDVVPMSSLEGTARIGRARAHSSIDLKVRFDPWDFLVNKNFLNFSRIIKNSYKVYHITIVKLDSLQMNRID